MSVKQPGEASEHKIFAFMIGGAALMGVVAIGLGFFLGTPIGPQLTWSINDIFVGIIATLPLALFLRWFSQTPQPILAGFRQSQIKFFSEIGFEFTQPRIIIMSIAAGISEELLFRGVFQSWIDGFAPAMIAVVVSNIIFGLLHMRTALYAIIAGLVGVYLGVIYIYTDNLLVPMVTHGLYDFFALIYTARAIQAYRAGR